MVRVYFVFENVGDTDQYCGGWDFDCYAATTRTTITQNHHFLKIGFFGLSDILHTPLFFLVGTLYHMHTIFAR